MINYQRRCLFSFSPQTEEAAVVIHRYPYAHIRSYQHNSEAIRRPYLSFSLVCVMACSGLYESGTTQRTGKHSLNWGRRCGDISPMVTSLKPLIHALSEGKQIIHMLNSLIAGGIKYFESSWQQQKFMVWPQEIHEIAQGTCFS